MEISIVKLILFIKKHTKNNKQKTSKTNLKHYSYLYYYKAYHYNLMMHFNIKQTKDNYVLIPIFIYILLTSFSS